MLLYKTALPFISLEYLYNFKNNVGTNYLSQKITVYGW